MLTPILQGFTERKLANPYIRPIWVIFKFKLKTLIKLIDSRIT